jgi:hypothetical protein
MDRINHTHNFFHFNNQQSSIDNHHSKSTASDFFLLSTLSHLTLCSRRLLPMCRAPGRREGTAKQPYAPSQAIGAFLDDVAGLLASPTNPLR